MSEKHRGLLLYSTLTHTKLEQTIQYDLQGLGLNMRLD
jgi:hypothetical protein